MAQTMTSTTCPAMRDIVSNRLLRSYMHHCSNRGANARRLIEREVSSLLHDLPEKLGPSSVTAIRDMAQRLFSDGFLAGSRTCLERKY